MKSAPEVSVITPTFNSKEFILDTVISVKNQTYKNWELILVDDASTDSTAKIIKDLADQDERIKIHLNTKNSGAAVTRNIGLKLAKGRFIAFLDSDDIWLATKLEKQVNFMRNKTIPISFTSYSLIDEKGLDLKKYVSSIDKVDYKEVLKNTIIGMSTSMIDTKIIGRNFAFLNIRSRQDLYLWITLLKKGHIAYGIKEILVNYRVRENSVSSNKIKGAKRVWYLYFKVEKLGFFKSLYYFFFYALNAVTKKKNLD